VQPAAQSSTFRLHLVLPSLTALADTAAAKVNSDFDRLIHVLPC
jgi:hypothetical protein